jgi:hypothetical protein
MKRWFTTILVFTLLLTVQACSGASGGDTTQVPVAGKSTPGTGTNSGTLAVATFPSATPTSAAEYVNISEIPMPASITASPEVAGAGEHIDLTSSIPLSATLRIQGPQETRLQIDMQAGKAGLDLPKSAPAGLYTLTSNDQVNHPVAGTFRIANEPGIWLAIDRSFVRPGHPARLHISAWGVPQDLPVVVEVHGSSFALHQLGPDPQTGQLVPSRFDQPPQLGDLLSRTWTLPEGINGEIDVVAGENLSDEETGFTSNAMQISLCSSPSFIKGDLGQAGQVRAVWLEGDLRAESVDTQSGPFQLEAGPGLVLLEIQRTGASLTGGRSSQAVRLDCGETADVGATDLGLEASLQAAYPLLGLTLDDLGAYTATFTGSLAFEHQGYTECDLTDGMLTVRFNAISGDPVSYSLEAPGVSGSGEYQAVFDLMDFLKGEASGPGTLQIVTDKVEDMMGVKGSFSANYDGEAGAGEISGHFSCFYMPLLASNFQGEESSHAQILGAQILGAKKSLASLSSSVQAAAAQEDTCRAGIIAYPNDEISPILGEVLATTLFKTTPRLSVLTTADIQALLGLQAERLLLGASDAEVQVALDALAGSLGVDFSFWLRLDQLDSQYVLNISAIRVRDARVVARASRSSANLEEVAFSDIYQEIAGKIQKAGICGKVDPSELNLKHGGKADINFSVSDLSGEPVNGAQVTSQASTCGSLEPKQGKTSAGEFKTTFEANQDTRPCDERLQFKAKSDTPSGEVETRADEGRVKLSVSDQWVLEMEMNLDLGEAGNSIQIDWHGNFHVNSAGKLVGSGTGVVQGDLPDYPCLILDFDHGDIRTESNPAILKGDFNFYIYGQASGQEEQASFSLDPLAVSVPLVYSFGNENCAEGATFDPITGPIVSMAAEQPTFILGLQELVLEAKDGATVQHTSTSGFPGTLTASLHHDQ